MSVMGRVATPESMAALRDRRRDLDDEARIERLRNEVLGTEGEIFRAAVGRGDDVALFLPREGRRAHARWRFPWTRVMVVAPTSARRGR